ALGKAKVQQFDHALVVLEQDVLSRDPDVSRPVLDVGRHVHRLGEEKRDIELLVDQNQLARDVAPGSCASERLKIREQILHRPPLGDRAPKSQLLASSKTKTP